MPQVDESQQARQDYNPGTGMNWEAAQGTAPVTSPGVEEAPPASDVAPAPSAEPVQDPASSEQAPAATPEPGTTTPFDRHPRWIERQQELERARQQSVDLQRQNQMLLETMQRVVPQPQAAPQVDPWAGLVDHVDPAWARFYQQQKSLFEYEASRQASQKIQPIMELADTFRRELAEIKVERFQDKNQEIKPGTPEYNQIATLVGRGLPLDLAKRAVMYDRLEAENRALQSKVASIPGKVRAAQPQVGNGMPATAGLPAKPNRDIDRASEVLDRGGSIREAASAFFRVGRK